MTKENNLERYQNLFNLNKYSEIYNELSNEVSIIEDKYILNVYALACMQLGKGQEAVNIITRAINLLKEDDFYIINNAGGIYLNNNDNSNAIKYLERALKLQPESISTHFGLARAYENNGNPDKAIKILEKALIINNKNEKVIIELVRLYYQENIRSEKIITLVKDGVKHFPNNVKLNNILADDLLNQGKIIEAFETYKKSVLINRDDYAYNHMVKILFKQGKEEDGFKIAELAINDNPNLATVYNNIGDICLERKDTFRAIKYYESSIKINPNNAAVLTNLASSYALVFQTELADQCYKKAAALSEEAVYIFNYARFLATIDNVEEAEKQNLKGLDLYPDNDLFYYNLAKLNKIKSKDRNFKQLIDLEKTNKDHDKGVNLNFAIGTVYEKEKKYKEASKYYKKANSLHKTPENYDIKTHINFHKTMIENFTEDFIQRRLSKEYTSTPHIFILGMPRCGSTLIEQIITSHSKTNTIGENPDFAEAVTINQPNIKLSSYLFNKSFIEKLSFSEIGNNYSNILKKYNYKEEIIVSKALSWELLPLIRLSLPNSKIILCKRNKSDQLLSIFKNRFSSQNQAYSYNLENLKTVYRSFNAFCDNFISMKSLNIYEIIYEDLVNDPNNNIKNIIKYCELDWEERCLKPEENYRMITTLSTHQVRKSISNKSINFSHNFIDHIPELFTD